MNLPQLYAALVYILPIGTFLGFVVKAYLTAKQTISEWANTLLDNHMSHIQNAAEKASNSLAEMSETNKEICATMKEMRNDFQQNQREMVDVQHDILTGIEILKSRV